MKTTLWKTLAALSLTVMLLCSASALALARYPARTGTLTDDANVLSTSVAADIAAYAEKAKAKTDVTVNVALVQFLDGEPVQSYADTLFTRWELGENDVLLLGAAAEDTFAVTAGTAAAQKLSAASLRSLMYDSGFAQAFASQRYDEAMGGFFTGFNALLNKQYGAKVDMGSLFAAYQQAQAQPQQAAAQSAGANTGADTVGQTVGNAVDGALNAVDGAVQGMVAATSSAWSSTVNAITNTVNNFNQNLDKQDENGGGLTPGGWVVLVIIVLIVTGQGRRAQRNRRRYESAAREARDAARSARDAARQAADQARDAARASAEQTRNSARNAAGDVRDTARDIANEVRNAAREAAREAKRAWREHNGRW